MKSSFDKPQEATMEYTTNQLEYIKAAPSEASAAALRIIGQLDTENRELRHTADHLRSMLDVRYSLRRELEAELGVESLKGDEQMAAAIAAVKALKLAAQNPNPAGHRRGQVLSPEGQTVSPQGGSDETGK